MMVLNEGNGRDDVEEGSGEGRVARVGLGGVDAGGYDVSEAEKRWAM